MPVTGSTIDKLLASAEDFEAQGYAAIDRGDDAAALLAFRRAQRCRFYVEKLQQEPLEPAPLPIEDDSSTLSTTMNAVQVRTRGASVSAALTDPDTMTLFQQKLQERNMSLPEWVATQSGLSHNTAQSWNKWPEKGGRKTPRLWANRIAKEFKEPRLRLAKYWRNGIRD